MKLGSVFTIPICPLRSLDYDYAHLPHCISLSPYSCQYPTSGNFPCDYHFVMSSIPVRFAHIWLTLSPCLSRRCSRLSYSFPSYGIILLLYCIWSHSFCFVVVVIRNSTKILCLTIYTISVLLSAWSGSQNAWINDNVSCDER